MFARIIEAFDTPKLMRTTFDDFIIGAVYMGVGLLLVGVGTLIMRWCETRPDARPRRRL